MVTVIDDHAIARSHDARRATSAIMRSTRMDSPRVPASRRAGRRAVVAAAAAEPPRRRRAICCSTPGRAASSSSPPRSSSSSRLAARSATCPASIQRRSAARRRSASSSRSATSSWRLFVLMKRQLLWRVRRKLILSYIFIGVVPALLIVVFFLFGGVLLFMNVSAYLFKDGYDDVVENARTDRGRGGRARSGARPRTPQATRSSGCTRTPAASTYPRPVARSTCPRRGDRATARRRPAVGAHADRPTIAAGVGHRSRTASPARIDVAGAGARRADAS